MLFKNISILVLWTKVVSALEGLRHVRKSSGVYTFVDQIFHNMFLTVGTQVGRSVK